MVPQWPFEWERYVLTRANAVHELFYWQAVFGKRTCRPRQVHSAAGQEHTSAGSICSSLQQVAKSIAMIPSITSSCPHPLSCIQGLHDDSNPVVENPKHTDCLPLNISRNVIDGLQGSSCRCITWRDCLCKTSSAPAPFDSVWEERLPPPSTGSGSPTNSSHTHEQNSGTNSCDLVAEPTETFPLSSLSMLAASSSFGSSRGYHHDSAPTAMLEAGHILRKYSLLLVQATYMAGVDHVCVVGHLVFM